MAAMEAFKHDRKAFVYEGRTIYEWDQSTDEVNIYTTPPPGVKARDIACTIDVDKVRLGLKTAPPLLNDEKLHAPIKKSDSFWTWEDGVVHITLTKQRKNEVWPSVFVRHGQLNPVEQEEARKRILLERFQEEHPGLDFSGAQMTGNVPDPSTFLTDLDNNH
ncbi:Nuclear distribution protein C [Pelomyxa schiedti]|nr:Nuclear distribution protein C [Pelomyxa schiedti]